MKANYSNYWDYVLLYCDDVLVISENDKKVAREEICKNFELNKEGSIIEPPSIYLNSKVSMVALDNKRVEA